MDDHVAIIIPNHNDGQYLYTCLNTIALQKHPNHTTFVINHGKDELAKAAVDWVVDTFHMSAEVHEIPHDGIKSPLQPCNHGLKILEKNQSDFDYVSFVGADGFWLPHKLALEMLYLKSNEDCGVCGSNFLHTTIDYQFLKMHKKASEPYKVTFLRLTNGNCVPDSSLTNISCHIDAGFKLDTEMGRLFWWDFWTKTVQKYEIILQPMPCFIYNQREDGLSRNEPTTANREAQEAYERRYLPEHKLQ